MLINCCYLHLNLLILAFLIHFSNCNCNWLRIGVSEISLPESDYIKQFSARQSRASQTRKMNHSNNDHPSHRKPTSVNNSIAKYFNGSNDADTFLNDVTGSLQSPEAVKQLQEYDAILSQFSSAQLKFIKRNPDSLAVLSEGTSLAIRQCAERFSRERWNCSIEDERELFAQTLARGNRESAFVQAIVSAGITYSLTQACSRGSLQNCACDYNRYERFSDIELARQQNTNQRVWHWAGCSDNLAFGIRLSKQFLDASARESRLSRTAGKSRASLKEMMNEHNNRAGREAIKRLMRLKCRCHGSSGSCQLKTCWRVLPNFDQIGKYLKKQYLQSVRIQGIVNHGSTFRLKRAKRATADLLPNELYDEPSARRLESTVLHRKTLADHVIREERSAVSSRLKRSVQPTNRVVSSQFNAVELGSNSFMVNKLNEKEIDQDDDYTDYDDYFENEQEDELEKKKLIRETNKVFSNKQSRETSGGQVNGNRPSAPNRPAGGQMERNSETAKQKPAPVAKTGGKAKQTTREKADKPTANKQISNQINSQVGGRQVNKQQAIGNEKFNGLGIEIENMIENVVSPKNNQQASTAKENFKSPSKLDLVFAYDSPNYCTANSYLKTLGTVNRSCRKVKRRQSDSCDLLCCGRGYDKRIVHKSEECQCEFDAISVDVKCKTCEFAFEMFTCK